MRSEFIHRFQILNDFRIDCDASKLIYDTMYPKQNTFGVQGFLQEINSNPFGFSLISEIQVLIIICHFTKH